MLSRCRRFECGTAPRRRAPTPAAPPLVLSRLQWEPGRLISRRRLSILRRRRVRARHAEWPSNHPSRVRRGLHRRREDNRDSLTRHRGDRPALPLARLGSAACLLALLHFHPPLRGGQTRGPSHLRRQISGNFHACANFYDHRAIPAHEWISSSFSPREPFGSHATPN
jgi:hypothetical protein